MFFLNYANTYSGNRNFFWFSNNHLKFRNLLDLLSVQISFESFNFLLQNYI